MSSAGASTSIWDLIRSVIKNIPNIFSNITSLGLIVVKNHFDVTFCVLWGVIMLFLVAGFFILAPAAVTTVAIQCIALSFVTVVISVMVICVIYLIRTSSPSTNGKHPDVSTPESSTVEREVVEVQLPPPAYEHVLLLETLETIKNRFGLSVMTTEAKATLLRAIKPANSDKDISLTYEEMWKVSTRIGGFASIRRANYNIRLSKSIYDAFRTLFDPGFPFSIAVVREDLIIGASLAAIAKKTTSFTVWIIDANGALLVNELFFE
ncbi:hypothetical protein HDU79_005508 [Rhizoclosmatium sp. JEL0117]|nr:hypothetical protein HDU79_005508 [Rhizoclosmatium sp. JEL0117]